MGRDDYGVGDGCVGVDDDSEVGGGDGFHIYGGDVVVLLSLSSLVLL